MTTLGLNFDIERVTREATRIKFTRVLLWLIAAPFLLLGLTLRLLWLAPAFLIAAGIDGWQSADKMIKQMQAQARESAARGG